MALNTFADLPCYTSETVSCVCGKKGKYGLCVNGRKLVPYEIIKEEAIKWIKYKQKYAKSMVGRITTLSDKNGLVYPTRSDYVTQLSIIEWIKYFFNITEDELK